MRRPGLVLAIGVLSICIGLLSALVDGVSLSRLPRLYAAAKPKWLLPAPKPPAPPQFAPYAGDLAVPAGLGRADREAVVAFAKQKLPNFSPDRQVMLRRLMGEFGRVALPPLRSPATSADVAAAVREAGQLPSGPDGLHTLGTHYLRTDAGAVFIDDGVARFKPAGPGGAEVRVVGDIAIDAAGQRVRSAVVVADELDEIHRQLHGAVNSMQAAALAKHLRGPLPPPLPPPQQSFSPGRTTFGFGKVSMMGPTLAYAPDISPQSGGSGPPLWIFHDGRLLANPSGVDPVTGIPLPPPAPKPATPLHAGTILGMMADAGLGVLFGVVLAVFGLMTLAGSPRAGAAHVGYAWAKLLLAAFSLVVGCVALSEAGTSAAAGAGVIVVVMGLLLQVTYPAALLLSLKLDPVRSYYEYLGPGVDMVPARTRQRIWPRVQAVLRRREVRAAAIGVGAFAALTAVGHLAMIVLDPEYPGAPWSGTPGARIAFALFSAMAAAAAFGILRMGGTVDPATGGLTPTQPTGGFRL